MAKEHDTEGSEKKNTKMTQYGLQKIASLNAELSGKFQAQNFREYFPNKKNH